MTAPKHRLGGSTIAAAVGIDPSTLNTRGRSGTRTGLRR